MWEHYSGKELDPTQRLTVEVMMATDSAGRWAAKTTGREMSRQNGKGDEIEVVEFWGLVQRAEAILHTIHDAVLLATEAQARLLALLEHRDLRGKVKRSWQGTGQQMIEMRNGGQIWYRTRTGGGGRGLDMVDRVVVDEMQHVKPEHMAAILPTMGMADDPQLNALGSGGIAISEWAWRLRTRALSESPGALGYVGHTAETVRLDDEGQVVQEEVDVEDRSLWMACNPGFAAGRGGGMPFLEEEFDRLGPDLFAQEHLCVWAPPLAMAANKPKVDPHEWRLCAGVDGEIAGPVVVAVDTGYDLDRSALVVSGRDPDGVRAVEVVQHDDGSHWVELALLDVLDGHEVDVVTFDASGPAKAFGPMLERITDAHGVKLDRMGATRYRAACAQFVADVRVQAVRHRGDTRLGNLAVSVPERPTADGWMWDRRRGDISPLAAATCALAAADALPERNLGDPLEQILV